MPSESNSEINNDSKTQDEGLIKDKYESIFKEIQGIISVFYIFAVAIGMLFTYQKYSEFGINIFDYADIFEFLVAPFSDVIILFFTAGSCVFVYLFFKFDTWLMQKHPKFYSIVNFGWNKKAWYSNRYVLFLTIFFIFLYSVADYYGVLSLEKTKKQTPISLRFIDNETKTGIIIGKTKEVIFLLEGQKVKAIPFTALVKEFEIKK